MGDTNFQKSLCYGLRQAANCQAATVEIGNRHNKSDQDADSWSDSWTSLGLTGLWTSRGSEQVPSLQDGLLMPQKHVFTQPGWPWGPILKNNNLEHCGSNAINFELTALGWDESRTMPSSLPLLCLCLAEEVWAAAGLGFEEGT